MGQTRKETRKETQRPTALIVNPKLKDREEHCVTALEWRPEGRRRPGRPKTTSRRMIEKERRAVGWQSWVTVRTLAANQSG